MITAPCRAAVAIGSALLAVQVSCAPPVTYPEGVLVDTVHFTKTVFYHADGMNLVSELRVGDFDHDGQREIRVLATDGIRLLDMEGRQKRFTPFQVNDTPWAIVSAAADPAGTQTYVGNLPNLKQTVLFDDSGHVLWRVAGREYDQPQVGDVDGDGRNEIVAKSTNGALQVINLDGKIGREMGPTMTPLFYSVADMDGDGKADFVGEDASGKPAYLANELSIMSGDGRQLELWESPHKFYRFFVARLRGRTQPAVMFHSDDAEELVFLDPAGKLIKSLKAPWGNHLAIPLGFTMKVSGKDGGFVCVASGKGSNHRHMVYVYASDDQLVYLDSVPDDAQSLLVTERGTTESTVPFFLVGGRNTVWKYQ